MSDVDVRMPRVTAQIADENLPVGQVNVSLVSGGLSTASVTLHEEGKATDGAAIDALNIDHTARVGAAQAVIFTARPDPDSTITIEDGQKHTLAFKGYLSNPSYRVGPGDVGAVRNVTHESVKLSGYRGNIYTFSPSQRDGVGSGDESTMPFMEFKSSNLGTRFMEVLDFQIARWQASDKSAEAPFSREVKEAWHTLNQGIYPDLQKVMQNSKGAVWDTFEAMLPSDHYKVSSFVREVILQQSDTFFSNLSLFEEGFQFQFVPSFTPDGGLGQFVSWYDIGRAPGAALSLPITSFQLSAGDKNFLPVTHVFLGGSLCQRWRGSSGYGQGPVPTPTLVAWPETPYAGGKILSNSGPPWLDQVEPDPEQGFQTQADSQDGLDLDSYQSGRASVNKFIGEITDTVKAPILKDWARNLYSFAALANSTTTFSIPLDVSIFPGQRYRVSNMKGALLFNGFLAQVSHSVAVAPKRGEGTTTLAFTHVEAGSFTLPGA